MTILCLLLHQFWRSLDTFFSVFHLLCCGFFGPVLVSRQLAWVSGMCSIRPGTHAWPGADWRSACRCSGTVQSGVSPTLAMAHMHGLTGTLLIKRGRLLLQHSGEIKTTMTVTGSPSCPLSCYYFMQLIYLCLSVRSLSPVTSLQPVSSLASLWCHTCRSGLSRNDKVSQVPCRAVLANQKTSTPGK